MAFFCAKSNSWVSTPCVITPPAASIHDYPAFDPISNLWVKSGNYGDAVPLAPKFCKSSNAWITSGKCP